MTITGCCYRENERTCAGPVRYEVRIDGKYLLLCDRHSQPRFWPPDLRRKLSGRLRRLLARKCSV
jgi:hypothetical protein